MSDTVTVVTKSAIDLEIDRTYALLLEYTAETDEYAKALDQLEKLYKIKSTIKDRSVSFEALTGILANLAGIAMILHHERVNVVTSKALGFVTKARV